MQNAGDGHWLEKIRARISDTGNYLTSNEYVWYKSCLVFSFFYLWHERQVSEIYIGFTLTDRSQGSFSRELG